MILFVLTVSKAILIQMLLRHYFNYVSYACTVALFLKKASSLRLAWAARSGANHIWNGYTGHKVAQLNDLLKVA